MEKGKRREGEYLDEEVKDRSRVLGGGEEVDGGGGEGWGKLPQFLITWS